MNDVASTSLSSAPPDNAALAWVLEQVRDNLLGALAAVRRQAQQAGASADDEAQAPGALLQARSHVHQACGALELLDQRPCVQVLQTAERVLLRALEQPGRLDAPMVEALEAALHAVLDYLEARAAGREEPAVKLFRQYRSLADLAGGDGAHPADLWDFAWDWPQPADDGTPLRALGMQARSDYERALLDVLRAGDLRGAGQTMQEVARQAQRASRGDERALWWIAEGFLSALGDGLIEPDIYVKRLCNRLNLQLRQMLAGHAQAPRRLGHELLFFCDQALAQANERSRQPPLALQEVARTLGLRAHAVVDWQQPHFGLVDPGLVQQARKRMVQVKDGWAHIGNGDFQRIARLQENLQQLALLLRQLCAGAEVLPSAVERMLQVIGEQRSLLTPERVLEVATSLLFLEASLVHFRADDAEFLPRARELAQRLQRSAQGYASEPFAAWMEQLYRKVSENQTLGTVVQELRHDMGTVERLLDRYFRDPQTLPELEPVPRLLGQMRGVLSVLGMDVGAQALAHIRQSVENLMAAPAQEPAGREAAGAFEPLAANIGALGFLVDMLGYQPDLAKNSFQFDSHTGELRPVVPHARGALAAAEPAPATASAPADARQQAAQKAQTEAGDTLRPYPVPLEEAETLSPPPEEAAASAAAQPDFAAELAPAAFAALDESPPALAPDPELLEIFLDEADEVIVEGRLRIADLRGADPADDSLTALRRSFHTLKGSSRMVGMNDFGEAAWALEQLFNQILAEARQPAAPALDLAEQALGHLQSWVRALRAGDGGSHSSAELVQAASRIRDGAQPVQQAPLPGPAAQPAAVEQAPLEAEPVAQEPADAAPTAEPPFEPMPFEPMPFEGMAFEGMPSEEPSIAEAAFEPPPLEQTPTAPIAAGQPPIEALPVAELPFEPEPAGEAAVEEAPVEEAPVEEAPVEEAPVEQAPVEQAPVEQAPAEQAPAEQATPAQAPTAPIAAGQPPIEALPVAELPFEPEPVEEAPVEEAAVEEAAVEEAPVEGAPVEQGAPAQAPTAPIAAGQPPIEALPVAELPFEPEPVEEAPVEPAPQTRVPAWQAWLHEQPPAETAAMDAVEAARPRPEPAPVEDTPVERTQTEPAPFEDAAGEPAAAQESAPRHTPTWPAWPPQAPAERTPGEEPAPQAPLQARADEPAAADLDAMFDLPLGPVAAPRLDAATPLETAHEALAEAEPETPTGTGPEATGEDEAAEAASTTSAATHWRLDWPDASLLDLEAAPAAAAEGPRSVDELHIPQALQSIYLNEADELVRRLDQSLAAWSLLPHLPIGDDAMALAHQLRGSSATVGLRSVQQVAGLLEQAIQGQSAHAQEVDEIERGLLPRAVDEMRRLLHQFAAGFVHPAPAELAAALQALVQRLDELGEATPAAQPPDEAAAWPWAPTPRAEPAASATVDAALPPPPGAQPVQDLPELQDMPPQPPAAELDELDLQEVPAQAPPDFAAAAADWQPMQPETAAEPELPVDTQARDAIDPELFPIFEFEAAELLPQLATALRQWEIRTSDSSAPRQAMRLLHTFKGSARMAGTMALGDMAHALEADIEALLGDDDERPAPEAAVTALVARCDDINTRFERLREAGNRGETELGEIHPERALLEQQAASTTRAPAGVPEAGGRDGVAAGQPAAAGDGARGFARAQPVRVQAALLDRLVNQVGEVSIARARLDSEFETIRGSVRDLGDNLGRLRAQVRDIELQADAQMTARTQATRDDGRDFDPLEFDRFTRFQELTRMMAESVDDLALVQGSLARALQSTEDSLARQSRLTRELQRDLLRTRMVEFDSISERLYRTVRQASKDAAKAVRLDIQGGTIELDRGVLDRMAGAFEHLLRNAVAHGLETPAEREIAGKPALGTITLRLRHEGSEVVVSVHDDGGGLRYHDIAAKARAQGLLGEGDQPTQAQLRELIFRPGFSSTTQTTEIAGRGIGLDVVRNDTRALGGRVEVESVAGQGTTFTLVLPLTTAVTQVVLLRVGERIHAVPSSLVDLVLRMRPAELEPALRAQQLEHGGQQLALYWLGALTDDSGASSETPGRTVPVVLVRSAAQRLALHVDEVLGNQEVVVKNLGPQLSRVPGLAGISVLPDGGVVLIYNPVALAAVHGDKASARMRAQSADTRTASVAVALQPVAAHANTVLVVDDSITVRRVTQRFLARNGYAVMLAKDGMDALEQLQQSLPDVVLTDIEMPRMDGFDLTRNIRADERTRHLPVIMITSRIADKHRNYAQELGVNHYLGKPYSEEELLGLLREYVLETESE